ncbi:MAG: hypothetical protein ACU84H_16925 [Gammaproteobacteria bacterium]
MTTTIDFSSAEWEVLLGAPHLMVLAVAVAVASGIYGSIAEGNGAVRRRRHSVQGGLPRRLSQ